MNTVVRTDPEKFWNLKLKKRFSALIFFIYIINSYARACSALEAVRNALYKCSTYLLTYTQLYSC